MSPPKKRLPGTQSRTCVIYLNLRTVQPRLEHSTPLARHSRSSTLSFRGMSQTPFAVAHLNIDFLRNLCGTPHAGGYIAKWSSVPFLVPGSRSSSHLFSSSNCASIVFPAPRAHWRFIFINEAHLCLEFIIGQRWQRWEGQVVGVPTKSVWGSCLGLAAPPGCHRQEAQM